MIIEMRTYTLQPGTVASFEERFAEALPVRAKVSPLAAFWHTEVGPLNRVIHVWPYEDLEERTRLRAEATKLQGWPPNTREFVVEQQSDVYLPAPFSPKPAPGQSPSGLLRCPACGSSSLCWPSDTPCFQRRLRPPGTARSRGTGTPASTV